MTLLSRRRCLIAGDRLLVAEEHVLIVLLHSATHTSISQTGRQDYSYVEFRKYLRVQVRFDSLSTSIRGLCFVFWSTIRPGPGENR